MVKQNKQQYTVSKMTTKEYRRLEQGYRSFLKRHPQPRSKYDVKHGLKKERFNIHL